MIVNFGKHKGKNVKDLPTDYLEWGVENLAIGYLKDEFEKELDLRQSDGKFDYDFNKLDYNELIFGKNNTDKIVNITLTDDLVDIYKADGTSEQFEYYPWVMSNQPSPKRDAVKLKGNQYYKYLTEVTCSDFKNIADNRPFGVWYARSLEESFMLREGYTYFKNLKPNDLSLLGFDIEATSIDPKDENAEVILISSTFRDRDGSTTKVMFDIYDYKNDKEMIADWCDWVRNKNPDVLVGHNIFGYDLNYLHIRSKNGLKLGRNDSYVNFDKKTSKFRKDGSQQYDYINAKCHGREIICSMFLSVKYDIGRNFPSYGLKQIEKYLELVDDSRTEWNFEQFKTRDYKNWGNNKWEEFKQYCADDSDSPIKIFDTMIPAFFYLNRSVPKTLQQMINEASGSQLDTLMIRAYLQEGYSQPKTSKKVKYSGAISMGIPGVYKNVRKVDVASLYPSIMLEQNIYDSKKDPKRYMLQILEYFRDERLTNKQLAKETNDQYYEDLQSAQKIVINSMYGFMGAGYLLYNYPEGAAKVCDRGQEILQIGVQWACGFNLVQEIKKITNKGKDNEEEKYHWVPGMKTDSTKTYQLVNVDTDSFSYTNGLKPSTDEFKTEISELNSLYSDLIKWEDDGVFDKVIVVKAKNYVLQSGNKIKYKGSSLTDQKKEPILIELLHEQINNLLEDKPKSVILETYKKYCLEALSPKNIRDWCKKITVTKPILECRADKKDSRENEIKPYKACMEAIENGIIPTIQEGDKVYVYQRQDGMKQKVVKGVPQVKKNGEPQLVENTAYRFPELFKNDHDQFHYVKRVYATMCILENVIGVDNLIKYANKSNRKLLNEDL